MPEGRGYGPGSGTTHTKKEPRATASQGSIFAPEYATAGATGERAGNRGRNPGGKESSPALKGASLGDRNVKYGFNSNPDKPDAMPRRKG